MPAPNYGPPTSQSIKWAKDAGFSGLPLVIIVCIARAESGLNVSAQSANTDGSLDRGILQINNHWHPEVVDGCAYDGACAFKAAYKISKGGTDFSPWVTYKSGAYAAYASYTGSLAGVSVPSNLQKQETQSQNANLGPVGNVINTVGSAVDAGSQLQNIFNSLPLFGIHIALFMFALMLVIIGLWILTRNPANDTGSTFNAGLSSIATSAGSSIGRRHSAGKAKREGKRAASYEKQANAQLSQGNEKKALKFTIRKQSAERKQETYAKQSVNATKARKEAASTAAMKEIDTKTPTVKPPPEGARKEAAKAKATRKVDAKTPDVKPSPEGEKS